MEVHGGQLAKWNLSLRVNHARPIGPQNHFVIISAVSGFTIGTDVLNNWRNSQISSLTRAKWNLELPLPTRTTNRKRVSHPWGKCKA